MAHMEGHKRDMNIPAVTHNIRNCLDLIDSLGKASEDSTRAMADNFFYFFLFFFLFSHNHIRTSIIIHINISFIFTYTLFALYIIKHYFLNMTCIDHKIIKHK